MKALPDSNGVEKLSSVRAMPSVSRSLSLSLSISLSLSLSLSRSRSLSWFRS